MLFKDFLNRIESSEKFRILSNEKEIELCAGFFILDFLGKDNKESLDYKSKDKVFTFSIDSNGEVVVLEDEFLKIPGRELKKINSQVNIEIDELKGIVRTEVLERGIHQKFQKIIAVLQNYTENEAEKQVWNLTCMLDGLIMLNVLIDSYSGEIIKFEKKNFMDFIKKI